MTGNRRDLLRTFGMWLLASGCSRQSSSPSTRRSADASDRFFAGDIRRLELIVKPQDAERLNRENRPWVAATLVEQDLSGPTLATWREVAIKLKGAAGSYQEFGAKPALTLRPDKFVKGQLFHNLAKFHLNNSVQDETYLHEQLCSELFLEVGTPAARVTHARVLLNGRDVGLYVFKEGFDERFLARHFARPDGNLYDGGFCTDIDADLEKDSGNGPDDRSDLIALREACAAEDEIRRAKRLEELVAIEAFHTFVAMELMTCHWDGYARNRNNYRLYFDPTTRQAHFFPHGMDQMFGDPGFSIVDHPEALVANAVHQNAPWRERFQARVNELLPLFSPPDKLLARVDTLHRRLRPVLEAMDPELTNQHAERVEELKQRIIARADSLEAQKAFPPPQPIEFDEHGMHMLADWHPATEVEDAVLELLEPEMGGRYLRIACGPGPRCIASWRIGVLLTAGRYRFVAKAKGIGIQPLKDEKGAGAGLRISGASRENRLGPTDDWQELAYEFAINEPQKNVEFVAELRAQAGEVLFDLNSLQLIRLPVAADD